MTTHDVYLASDKVFWIPGDSQLSTFRVGQSEPTSIPQYSRKKSLYNHLWIVDFTYKRQKLNLVKDTSHY